MHQLVNLFYGGAQRLSQMLNLQRSSYIYSRVQISRFPFLTDWFRRCNGFAIRADTSWLMIMIISIDNAISMITNIRVP